MKTKKAMIPSLSKHILHKVSFMSEANLANATDLLVGYDVAVTIVWSRW